MKWIQLLIVTVLAVLILSACNESGAETVSVNMREFSFTPDHFTVPAGADVTLTLRNLGALDHNFHIMELGYVIEGSWDESDEAGSFLSHFNLPGGEVSTTSFIAPNTPGEYQILCSIPSHFELGMEATLTVTEGE